MSSYGPISCPAVAPVNPMEGVIPREFHGVILRAGVATLSHPMEYAKVLIQIGHEPLAPKNTKNFFGTPKLQYPSVLTYIGLIRKRDGFLGLYRGCAPKLVGIGLSSVVSDQFSKFWPCPTRKNKAEGAEPTADEIIEVTTREACEKLACLVVCHPFHVCMVRAMAQFVGKEDKYDGLFGAIASVYREDGILGYWSGFVPRAIGELATVGFTAAAAYLINTYVLEDKSLKVWTEHIASFFATSLCYPFHVVGNCMVVAHSQLAASYPPHMPLYRNWLECWSHLSRRNQLKRGSSLLIRYYTGPQVVVGDRVVRID